MINEGFGLAVVFLGFCCHYEASVYVAQEQFCKGDDPLGKEKGMSAVLPTMVSRYEAINSFRIVSGACEGTVFLV